MSMRNILWILSALLAAFSLLACLARLHIPPRIHSRIDAAIRDQIVWQQSSPPAVEKRFARDNHPGDSPVHLRLFLFNITNLEEVQAGAKPILAELGPYTYVKHRVKRHVWFSPDGRVKFKEYSYHLPAPELTNGSLDDLVTTLNIPLVGALEVVGSLSHSQATRWLQLLVSLIESFQDDRIKGLFTTRTVRELLWGYEDPLLARLAPFLPSVNPTFQLLTNMTAPREADKAYAAQINTGLHNISQVWQYEQWNNLTRITSWNPPHIECVRGTDAFQFRPGLAVGQTVEVWVGELFRVAQLVAEEQVTLGPVPLLRFRADPKQGDPDDRYFQYVQGLMNITSPKAAGPSGKPGRPGPPLFLSYPHYCQADERLQQGVEGLSCDPVKHDLFVDVEPTTGITLRAAKRLMLSSWFGGKWHNVEASVRDTFLPIFWAEEASEASGEQLEQFRPMLRAKAAAAAIAAYALPAGLIAVGLAALCAGLALWLESQARSRGGMTRENGEIATTAGDVERDVLQPADQRQWPGAAAEPAGALRDEAGQPLLTSAPI